MLRAGRLSVNQFLKKESIFVYLTIFVSLSQFLWISHKNCENISKNVRNKWVVPRIIFYLEKREMWSVAPEKRESGSKCRFVAAKFGYFWSHPPKKTQENPRQICHRLRRWLLNLVWRIKDHPPKSPFWGTWLPLPSIFPLLRRYYGSNRRWWVGSMYVGR